jgi:hypothetical protein
MSFVVNYPFVPKTVGAALYRLIILPRAKESFSILDDEFLPLVFQ